MTIPTTPVTVITKIPVIDFSNEDCLKPGTSSWLSVRKEVCYALEELGCFSAILPETLASSGLRNTMFGAANELFDSPIEIKTQTNSESRKGLFGYFKGNSAHENLGIWNPSNPEETSKFTKLFWPNGNDQFRDGVALYTKLMEDLDQAVTRMVFENYGVDQYHEDHIRSSLYALRYNKYLDPKKAREDVGLRSHTDKNFTSILHQNVNGLEVNTKEGEWIGYDPHPLSSSFLFIASDVFQAWSNDRIRACRHRVTLSHIKEDGVRYSLGLFSLKQGITHIPKELVDDEHPLRYKPFDQIEYIQAQAAGVECTLKEFSGI
ncbi:probable 2-oxoglutarate-dependent dioxygenase AOP1 [Argentina anserina]|uniref:probable 2-oxoglutarate-dependent dioxygenase AOP1 n=1 Tax=Argentina anserina TaxID=57926 RepID=UPI0021765E1A|nr:probable 2-oxoglutarate-dependent dioxygenase AOP1 [Potentilla anserina]